MISVDMLAYAMDHPGRSASIILMSDDHELMYTLLALRHRGLHVTAVGPADSRIHLEEIATRYVEWEGMRVAETAVVPKDNSSRTEDTEDTIYIAPVSEKTLPEDLLEDTSAAILAEQPQSEETEAIHFIHEGPVRPEVDEQLHAIPGTLNAAQIETSSSFAPMNSEALPAPSSSQPVVVDPVCLSPGAIPLDFCLHPQEYLEDERRPEVNLSTGPIASSSLEPLETTRARPSTPNLASQTDPTHIPFIDFLPLVNTLLRQKNPRALRWMVNNEVNAQHPLADYRKGMSMKGYLALAEKMGVVKLGETAQAKKALSQWISLGSDWQTRLKQAHAYTDNIPVASDHLTPPICTGTTPSIPLPAMFKVLIQILREAPGNAMNRQAAGHCIIQRDPGVLSKAKCKSVTAYLKLACQDDIIFDNQTGDGLGAMRWVSLHPTWRISSTNTYGLFSPPNTMFIVPPGIVPSQFEGLFEFLDRQFDGRATAESVAEHMLKKEYTTFIVDAGSIDKYLMAACLTGIVTLNNCAPSKSANRWISLSPGWHSVKVNLAPLVPGTAPLPARHPGDPLPHHLSISPAQAVHHPLENTINTDDVADGSSSPNPTLYNPIPSTQLDTENGPFQTLIDELSKYPAARQEYDTIDKGLMTRSPMVYAQAGVTTFAEYASLAAKAGIVTTGQYRQGSGTISWVFLHPRLRAQPVLERSSNTTHPMFDLLITVLRALGSGRKEMSAVAVALQTRDPLVYTKASTASSNKYFKKAAQQGIIIRGGDNSFKWIELTMAWRLPAADPGSSDARYERIPSRGPTLAGAEMPLFQKLIELLQQQTDCRMPLSTARNILRKSDPGIFAKAGCPKMQAYMQLASRKGVIILFEEMVFNGKIKRYVQLTAAYQPSVTPPLSSPPIPIYTSAEPPKFAPPEAEYPDIAQRPSNNADPEVSFSRLVGILQDMHDNGVSRPYQSTVHAHLINGHSSIYEEAGVQGYAEYFGLAKDQGIVELGGVGLRQYVSLIL
ncbi:hypothetical protein HWV62_22828 [Athelia sp. TMB]|nr:hypothetical protein HWV62_22828 [Athelia sp. TMB]